MSPATPNRGGVMGDWKRNSIAGGPSPQGMSPVTPNQDIPGALHLDFFFRAGASRTASPCHGVGGNCSGSTREVGAAITPSWPGGSTSTITDGTLRQPGAGSNGADRTTRVVPPSRKRRRSGARAPCPSFTMLSTIPEHDATTFVDNEDGDHRISGHGSETEESMREEAMLAAYSEKEEEEEQQQQHGEDVQEEEKEEEEQQQQGENADLRNFVFRIGGKVVFV
ncbi:histone H3.v1-like [Brachypodium distachyon]|uniref:histone H3.v1-like n=1 Tax=Brachypodium distachyon TaxID=15368 RepID=UPI000D0DB831|nr:histone H3.v1-like [Brachypodium distachyon]|eukprot:XP_024311843.1 histone H3.v1-like [Brachypodium distachyon]